MSQHGQDSTVLSEFLVELIAPSRARTGMQIVVPSSLSTVIFPTGHSPDCAKTLLLSNIKLAMLTSVGFAIFLNMINASVDIYTYTDTRVGFAKIASAGAAKPP